jgi:hypothetical protein
MKSFMDEIRIIPRIVWPIALLIAGAVFSLPMFYWWPKDPYMSKLSIMSLIGFASGPTLFAFICTLLVGYVYADARRRGMRYIMWTLLTIFVIYGIGFILYFVLREPLLVHCPKCNATGRSGFIFCPQCGAELAASCPACKRAVEPEWKRCVYCGIDLDLTAKPLNASKLSGPQ